MKNNDFYCEMVLSNKINVDIVCETEHFMAFHHTKPAFERHIVVIPKKHIQSIRELYLYEKKLIIEMHSIIDEVMRLVESEYGGCRLTTNIGNLQETKHLHWHVYYDKQMI
ncbi:MAG: HIT domain-containing protein [Chlorobaculum sp.]|nr:HIT domain-containing protein [Chlorobaculum sp.]